MTNREKKNMFNDYIVILSNDNWLILWFSPRIITPFRKWLFTFYSIDKYKRFQWIVTICGLQIGRTYKGK
jgi:hypothetical protein